MAGGDDLARGGDLAGMTVRIPAALRADTQGRPTIHVDAPDCASLAQILDLVGAGWPLLERRIRDERGELRRFVNVYVDGQECRALSGLDTTVPAGTEILIVPSVAGG